MSSNEGLNSLAVGKLSASTIGGLVRIDTGPTMPNGEHAGRIQGRLEAIEHSRDYNGDLTTELTVSLYDDNEQTVRLTYPSEQTAWFPTRD